jgi:hypothetical protein
MILAEIPGENIFMISRQKQDRPRSGDFCFGKKVKFCRFKKKTEPTYFTLIASGRGSPKKLIIIYLF